MSTTVMTNIIKYFGKFPDKAGVLKCFNRDPEKYPGYDDLKDYFTNLPAGLIPDISDFVFGSDMNVIANRIQGFKDFFLFVEYGEINATAPDNFQNRKTDLLLAITIAHQNNINDLDNIEDIMLTDQCLDLLLQIKNIMLDDDSETCIFEDLLQSDIKIQQLDPVRFYNNLGYVMSIRKNDYLLI